MFVASQEIKGDLSQFLGVPGEVQSQDTAVAQEPLVMFSHLKDVELLRVGVPVGADPFEDSRAVVQRVRADTDLGFGERDKPIVEVSVGHASFPSLARLTLNQGGTYRDVRKKSTDFWQDRKGIPQKPLDNIERETVWSLPDCPVWGGVPGEER